MGSEWQQFCLADAGSIVTGKTPRGGIPEFEGSDVPFVTPPDFNGSMWIERANRSISELGAQSVKGSIIPRGSVLVTCIGSDMGKAALTASRCVTNQQINAVLVDETKFCPEFIYYNLSLRKDEIRGLAGGSAQPILNKSAFSQIRFWAPPLSEQRTIATALRPLNDRIALLRETNATLEAIAQALFKSWFVDFDPVHARAGGEQPAGLPPEVAALFPDSFEESELGMIPKGWGVQPIRDVVEGVYDGPHATPPESDVGPVFLGIKNLTGTALDLSDVRHIADEDFIKWTKRVTPKAGDIVFSYEATLGFFALIPDEVKCCLGRRLALIRPMAIDGHGHFWFHQFVAAPFQRHLDKHTIQGATVNRIALKEFPGYPVLNPPSELKQAFEVRAAAIWHKIHLNQKQAQTLANLRDTLLPRLITGQLRLPDAEAMVAEAQA
ncbi:restriction endonuclease subunit S [Aeromonas veronii]|uniref:restriction endonuclease subunit S n=1 Tax=Aeromonas veronii TaxID=654 RepID=UPI0031FD2361